MAEYPTSLATAVYTYLKPGMRALDLGAGTGKHAMQFLDKGAVVTAVEPISQLERPVGINWYAVSVETFVETCPVDARFDLIFVQNLLHFLPKPWVISTLLPWIGRHTAPGGLVAIRAFTTLPIPPYDKELSYYTPIDLKDAFLGWEKIVSETMESKSAGYHFFLLDRAARKPSTQI